MIERLNRFVGGPSFHRGLALGALVGAAIAGSTLWTRVRDDRRRADAHEADAHAGLRVTSATEGPRSRP
jgi:hypothetical protein